MPAKTERVNAGGPCRNVKVLPAARPTPPPPRAKPPTKPEVLCASGEACPANAEIGRPEKIRATKGKKGYCDRCLGCRGDRATRDLKARRAGGAPRMETS